MRGRSALLAVALAALVVLLTGRLWAGLLAGGALWLGLRYVKSDAGFKDPFPPPTRGGSSPPETTATPIEVVCKTVTPLRQEWASVRTGRLYDVLSANGLPNAAPGDRGYVTLTPTGWRITRAESISGGSEEAWEESAEKKETS